MNRFLVIILLSLSGLATQAQHTLLHLNHKDFNVVNHTINANDIAVHSGFKPFLKSYIGDTLNIASILYRKSKDRLIPRGFYKTWFWRKFRNEDFVDLKKKHFRLKINPLLNIEAGQDREANTSQFVNTRGIMIEGTIGRKFGFYTSFYENQATYPEYINDYILQTGMVPGQGTPKIYQEDGHDFSRAEGYISFTPLRWLNVQAGSGKHFVGEGYRSLLLSDNAFNYPYLKFTFKGKKWQLVSMYTQFTDFGKPSQVEEGERVWHYEYHYRRHSSMTYLSYRPNKRVELGLFESVMWLSTDTVAGETRNFEKSFFSPIPLVRTINNGLGSENNVMLGLNAKVRITKDIQFYSQLMLDETQTDTLTHLKYGYQVGLKYWNVATLPNLYLQAEYNVVSPYAYAHRTQRSNWTHSNQPLAHPLGANFSEIILRGSYRLGDFYLEGKFLQAQQGKDGAGEHWGSNIYLSDADATEMDNITQGQGISTTIRHIGGSFSYVLNPRYNLELFVFANRRTYTTPTEELVTDYLGFGVRTRVANYYFDF